LVRCESFTGPPHGPSWSKREIKPLMSIT
jgi:hypothetical protein